MTRMYAIVTNRRLISEYVSTYIEEIRNMQENYNQEVIFAVIDESSKDIQAYNKQLLSQYKKEDIKIVHFDSQKLDHLFTYMKGKLDSKLIDLLDYEGFSYSRAMNKQFLVANIFHSDYLHRRDSDVKIMKDKFGFPSDVEIKYLGSKLSEINTESIDNSSSFKNDQVIYLVGSGYSGKSDWKADFGALIEKDSDLIGEITQLFKYGDSLSAEYMNEILSGNVSVENKLTFLPPVNHPNPICGNISYYKIFNYLPCCTVLDTIGSDNLIRTFLKRLNLPIVYHNNFVYHKFSNDRNNNDIEYIKSYWPRLINKLIYYRAIEKIIISYLKKKINKIYTIENIDFANIMNMDLVNPEYLSELCTESIDSFKKIIFKARNPRMKELYSYINNKAFYDKTISNMYSGLVNGDILLKNWSNIVSVCREYGHVHSKELV